ncbi:MAG: hypothetical protein HOV80_25730 [Polyangiaceae bacterium]|nr:hypothetical protein [Polyangiaceae bacterium]
MMLSKFSFSMGFGLVAAALLACESTVDTSEPEDDDDGGTTSAVTSGGATTSGNTTTGQSGTSSSSAQTTGAGGGDGGAGQGGEGEGGRAEMICAAMELLTLSDPVVWEAGGDEVWEAGEQASIRVTMTNQSFGDNFWYPGVAVTTDNPLVTVSGNTLFGIFGASSTEIDLVGQADPSVPPGTEVELTFVVTSLNQPCEDLATTTLTVTIE